MDVETFFTENGFLFILPVGFGLLKLAHDFLPHHVFFGILVACTCGFILHDHLTSSEEPTVEDAAEATEELIHDFEKEQKKANKAKMVKQRQAKERQRSQQRKKEQSAKRANTSVEEEQPVVPAKKAPAFKGYDADDGDADLLRYAAQMKKH